jgi:hypothetical protein
MISNENINKDNIYVLENKVDELSEQHSELEIENKKLNLENQNIMINFQQQNQFLEYQISLSENKKDKILSKYNNLKNQLMKIKLVKQEMNKIKKIAKKNKIVFENKLREYKFKIIVLKKKIKELHYKNNMNIPNLKINNESNKNYLNFNVSKSDRLFNIDNSNNYENSSNAGYKTMTQFYPRNGMNGNNTNNE